MNEIDATLQVIAIALFLLLLFKDMSGQDQLRGITEGKEMKEYIERAAVCKACKASGSVCTGRDCEIPYVPAADVVEVRHGRWIEDERTYPGPGLKNNLCSVCGEIAGAWKEGLAPERKWAYCPNCGARMGKEDEHEAG